MADALGRVIESRVILPGTVTPWIEVGDVDVAFRVTVPLKVWMLTRLMLVCPVTPCGTVTDRGLASMVKSGICTVTGTMTWWVIVPV